MTELVIYVNSGLFDTGLRARTAWPPRTRNAPARRSRYGRSLGGRGGHFTARLGLAGASSQFVGVEPPLDGGHEVAEFGLVGITDHVGECVRQG